MIILEAGNLMSLIIGVYLIAHLPAILLIIYALSKLKTHPKNAKMMLIIAGIYFIVGAGICGSMFT